MKHIVVSETMECPKCNKDFSGACVQILEMVVCTHCFYEKYEKELEPIVLKMLRDFFSHSFNVDNTIREVCDSLTSMET